MEITRVDKPVLNITSAQHRNGTSMDERREEYKTYSTLHGDVRADVVIDGSTERIEIHLNDSITPCGIGRADDYTAKKTAHIIRDYVEVGMFPVMIRATNIRQVDGWKWTANVQITED